MPRSNRFVQLLREGKRDEAGRLAMREFVSEYGYGKPDFGAYQPFCDLLLDFGKPRQPAENYRRALDLDNAVASVTYRADGSEFRREYLCSHPDQAVAIRLSSNHKGKISFRLGVTTPHVNSTVTADKAELVLSGQVATPDAAHPGMKFEARVRVLPEGGTLAAEGSQLVLQGADAATVLLVGATNYCLAYPRYQGRPAAERNRDTLAAPGKVLDAVRAAHVADYQRLFRRVTLAIAGKSRESEPTDARLQAYRKSHDDRGLEVLLFQYGRYLLISSSRPGGLPANLQGLWNNSTKPPWNCDYHLNINLQMNYWPAGPANLPSARRRCWTGSTTCARPARRRRKVHYNARGWVVHHVANVWGFTSPGPARGVHMMEAESAGVHLPERVGLFCLHPGPRVPGARPAGRCSKGPPSSGSIICKSFPMDT